MEQNLITENLPCAPAIHSVGTHDIGRSGTVGYAHDNKKSYHNNEIKPQFGDISTMV